MHLNDGARARFLLQSFAVFGYLFNWADSVLLSFPEKQLRTGKRISTAIAGAVHCQ